ncbi:putative choline transporter, variant 2 [Naganishia albida]|nr:putative choline transporter, variant 2 [Naganishia albida]
MSAAQYYDNTAKPPTGPYPPQQYQQQPYPQPPYAAQQYAPPSMPPTAPYAEPQGFSNTAPNGGQFVVSDGNEKTGQRFKPKKRFNDPLFAIAFVAVFAGFVALSAITIRQFVRYNGAGGGFGSDSTGSARTLDYHTVYLLLVASGLALLLAFGWLMIVRAFTKVIMEITLVLSVVFNIGVCVYYFVMKYWSGAIIFLVIAIISVLSYWFMRKRIPLAKLLFQTTVDVSKHHPSVYFVTLLGLIVQTAWNVWYSFTCVAIYVTYTVGSPACTTNSCSSGKVAGLIFFATFAYIWVSQVIANVILATLAGGVYGGWYYSGPRDTANKAGVPAQANLKAFIRATTSSLGSIAFGSLIVTVLEVLRTIMQVVAQNEQAQGDIVGTILACCATCCISCLSWMVQYFNKYAYIEIALYGKPYIPAAKDTWNLLRKRGIDALVNDSLVGIVLTTGAYIVGLLTALFAYLYLRYTTPAYNADGQYTAPVILFGALIGLNVGLAVSSAIDAGVSTIFVGLGEDPYILQERSPALFGEIQRVYPQVVQPVGGV